MGDKPSCVRPGMEIGFNQMCPNSLRGRFCNHTKKSQIGDIVDQHCIGVGRGRSESRIAPAARKSWKDYPKAQSKSNQAWLLELSLIVSNFTMTVHRVYCHHCCHSCAFHKPDWTPEFTGLTTPYGCLFAQPTWSFASAFRVIGIFTAKKWS